MNGELLINKPPKDSNSYIIEMNYLWFLLMCDMENEENG